MSDWISVDDRLPESADELVIVYWGKPDENGSEVCVGAKDTVHVQDFFDDITCGIDDDGNQMYTKWYIGKGITHWMAMPDDPC
ncbi:MAG: DUF551 domain-containing protein [Aeromonadaceae bacterium]